MTDTANLHMYLFFLSFLFSVSTNRLVGRDPDK